jgi:hypothetical protein
MPARISPVYPSGIKKVHVGCGPHAILSDWWNVDIRKFSGIDEAIDATQPWPYTDLRYVYAEHFLEHLTIEQALLFLTHAGNSLRMGGVIRLSTPNLEWVIHTHFQTGKVDLNKRLMDTLRTNRAFHGWGHQFLYSQEMLEHLLFQLGYANIKFCNYGQSDHPDLTNIEKHGGFSVAGGFPSVIIVEAARGDHKFSTPDSLMAFLRENYLKQVASGH